MAVVITQTANPAGVAAVATVATYNNAAIGAEHPDRIVVVLVTSELANSGASACTIDYGGGDVDMNAGTQGPCSGAPSQPYFLRSKASENSSISAVAMPH